MFGYVKVYQPELKMGEFEQYRGIYCSLCKTLGKRYGFLAQMTLNYDMTFLALLYLALAKECVGFHKGRCPFNPLKKRTCCQNSAALEFCADASVLLVYHKTTDTIHDDRYIKRFIARLMLPFMRHNRTRAAKRLPEIDRVIEQAIAQQYELEKQHPVSLDQAAEPTAQILGTLCAETSLDEKQKRILFRLGYCLGRWVYLIDAADDLEEDLKNGAYNPIALSHEIHSADKEQIRSIRESLSLALNASLGECKAAYELLNIRRFNGILRNILEYGIPTVQKQVLFGKRKNRHADQED